MSGRKILRRFSSSISDLLSIQRKATTNDERENGTALHTAVQMGNAVMAQALLEAKNVWIDEEDGKGRTALHYAMEQNSTEIASVLLRFGANVDCVDFAGTSASHIACQEGILDAFQLLLYYQADICSIDKNGKTPFDFACEFGQDKMVEYMLYCGVDMTSLKKAGNTHTASALHLAARNGHTHIVLRLLEAGWEINHTTSMGSALHEAAGCGRGQVVRFLLHAGIDTTLTTTHGYTALEVAKKNAHKNPITIGEIKFLLKEHKKFVYGEALRDHLGVRADELSFSKGDLIWIIDRGARDGKDKGVIFGQKANSRSGLFEPSAVKIVERPQSDKMSLPRPKKTQVDHEEFFKSATLRPNRKKVATVRRTSVIGNMSSRISMGPMMQTFGHPQERKAKKFDIPVVPKINVTNSYRNSAAVDVNRNLSSTGSFRMVQSPSRMSDDSQNGNSRRPLNSFGTDAHLTLGKPAMTTIQYPSTSTIPVDSHRQSTGSNCSQSSSGFESMKNGTSSSSSASSFHTSSAPMNGEGRSSMHSSASGGSGPSSLASCSVDALDESFSSSPYEPSVDVTQMVARGIPEAEILAIWLDKLNMSEYLSLFFTQGYDLSTIARITPEDLLTVGVTNPDHRKLLMVEIHSWHITDSWPSAVPVGGLKAWLEALSLPEYIETFYSQRYTSVQEVINLSWEDLEDIGIKRLGHLKRILLAAKKIKEHRNSASVVDTMKYITTPVQVQSPRLQARPLEPYGQELMTSRYNDPPPPAPNSARGKPLNGGIDYFSYSRGSRNPPPPPPIRNDDYATYTRNVVSQQVDTYVDMRKREPLKLNFYGTGQILSEARERDNISVVSGSTMTLDIPVPAPLAIDSSIRRLQDACASSASIGSISSGSSFDIPFANENCGTIRARDARTVTTEAEPGYSARPMPPPINANCAPRPSILKKPMAKENVLNSIGSMLDSLTAELDDMLEPYNRKKQTK